MTRNLNPCLNQRGDAVSGQFARDGPNPAMGIEIGSKKSKETIMCQDLSSLDYRVAIHELSDDVGTCV